MPAIRAGSLIEAVQSFFAAIQWCAIAASSDTGERAFLPVLWIMNGCPSWLEAGPNVNVRLSGVVPSIFRPYNMCRIQRWWATKTIGSRTRCSSISVLLLQ